MALAQSRSCAKRMFQCQDCQELPVEMALRRMVRAVQSLWCCDYNEVRYIALKSGKIRDAESESFFLFGASHIWSCYRDRACWDCWGFESPKSAQGSARSSTIFCSYKITHCEKSYTTKASDKMSIVTHRGLFLILVPFILCATCSLCLCKRASGNSLPSVRCKRTWRCKKMGRRKLQVSEVNTAEQKSFQLL